MIHGLTLGATVVRWLPALVLGLAPETGALELPQPPVLVAFAINDSATRATRTDPLVLSHRVVGVSPTHYRVSTRADFAGAPWLDYIPAAAWTGPREGTSGCGNGHPGTMLKLYFQVRAMSGSEVRIVNGQRTMAPVHIESNVLGDAICVEP